MADLQAEFAKDEADLQAEFERDAQNSIMSPEGQKSDDTTLGDAAFRAIRTGVTLGQGDKFDGIAEMVYEANQRGQDRVSEAWEEGDITKLGFNPVDELKKSMDDYRKGRTDSRIEDKAGEIAYPNTTGALRVVGTMANPGTYIGGPAGAAMVGAIGAEGLSNAELTPDKITADSALGAAKDTATGAVLSAAGAKYPEAARTLGLGFGGYAASQADNPADRAEAITGMGLSIPGMVSDKLTSKANKHGATADKARGQVVERVKGQNFKDDAFDAAEIDTLVNQKNAFRADEDKAAIAKVRDGEKGSSANQKINARIAELQESLSRYTKEDLAKETIAKARQSEAAELQVLKQRQKEVKGEEKLSKLNKKEEDLRARQEFKAGKSEVDTFENETKEVNKRFSNWYKAKVKEQSTREKIKANREKQRNALAKNISDAEMEAEDLQRSADAARAAAFKSAATRISQFPGITGKELPEAAFPLRDKVANSYENNSNWEQLDPDYVQAHNYEGKKAQVNAKANAARRALEQFDAEQFDENAAVQQAIGNAPDREAYEQAKKMGLDVGMFEAFDPHKPMRLNKAPPRTPEALPTSEEVGLANVETQRRSLLQDQPSAPTKQTDEEILANAGIELPKNDRIPKTQEKIKQLQDQLNKQTKPEDEILREAGLDKRSPVMDEINYTAKSEGRPSAETQADTVIGRAGPDAVNKIKNEVGKQALYGGIYGVGPAAATGHFLGSAGLGAGLGAGAGALGGGYFSAKKALRTLTEIDPETGNFKNPEQVSAVFRSLENAFRAVPNLGKKYAPAFSKGVTPTQVMYYLQNDKELAKTLDEQASKQDTTQP